jgi:iron complex transport system substrate-binding protein
MSALVRRARVASIALLILFLAACSAGNAASPTPVATESSVVASVPAASAAPTAEPTPGPAFPVTLTDDEGTTVELAAQPQKIVSLTPAATEILFAIGAADRVVAKVQDIANHPPEAADLPVVATFQGVDTEQIVGLGADLVIAGGNFGTPPDAIEKLRSLGIPVLVLYAPTIDAALKDIELVGAAAGEADAAKDLAASMRAGFDQVQAATSDLPKPRVFYETGTLDTAVYGIADDSVYEELLRLAGADPVTTGSPTSWEMPTEVLITADPEIILLGDGAYGVTADAVAARPGWDVLTAVKDGAIAPVDDIVVTRPGPRLVEGLHALARAIHPDVALPSLAPVAP